MSIKKIVKKSICCMCEVNDICKDDCCEGKITRKVNDYTQQIISEIVGELEKKLISKEYIFTETINAQNLGIHLAIETIKKMGEV